jgi:hypothetical protein
MKIPTWINSRDPLCWFLGAGTFGFLVATNNPNPIFVGASVALMGIPAAFGIDDLRRQRRENKSSSGSGTDLPSSSGPDSAVLPSLPSSLPSEE